jgi:hypothetical protein
MDPSKPQNATDSGEPSPANVQHRAGDRGTIVGEIWFNAIIGMIFIAAGFTFARFLAAKLTGQPFHTYVNWTEDSGASGEVPYFDLEGYTAWTHMGMFCFGVVLLLEAAAIAAMTLRPGHSSRALLAVSFAFTLATSALNAYICIRLFGIGVIPVLSGLAVAYGGWIILSQWRMLRSQSR